MAVTFHAMIPGKFFRFRARVGNSGLFFNAIGEKFSVTTKLAKIDITNSESWGFGEYVGGVVDADISLDGFAVYLLDQTPLLAPRVALLDVVILTWRAAENDVTGPQAFYFPYMFIEEFEITGSVKEAVKFRLKGSANGPFLIPAAGV